MSIVRTSLDTEMSGQVVLSEDEKYRYYLSRTWEIEKGILGWVMLNPSTADEVEPDPTIRRCIGFAKDLGFGAIIVLNLFSLRSSDPTDLKGPDDPIGPVHYSYLSKLEECKQIIAGWGAGWLSHPQTEVTIDYIRRVLRRPLYALRVTADGSPGHPLYLPKTCRPSLWADYVKQGESNVKES